MPQKTSKKLSSDRLWAKAFSKQIAERGLKPKGDEWKTIHQLVNEHNVPRGRMTRILSELKELGEVKTFNGSEYEHGMAKRRVWYALVQPSGRKQLE